MRVPTATSIVLLSCLCLSDAGCSQSVPEPPPSVGNSDSAASHEATAVVPNESDSADDESEEALEPNVEPSATVAAEPQQPEHSPESVEAAEVVEAAEGMSRKDMLKQASNGVVLITSFDTLGEETGFGSGSIVGERLVLTNLHNLSEAVTARVQLKNENDEVSDEGLPVTGYRILDEANDLALLEVD